LKQNIKQLLQQLHPLLLPSPPVSLFSDSLHADDDYYSAATASGIDDYECCCNNEHDDHYDDDDADVNNNTDCIHAPAARDIPFTKSQNAEIAVMILIQKLN
jgi:hypothetical protein